MAKKKFEVPVIQVVKPGMPGKTGMGQGYAPIKDIEGIPVSSLIEKYGSPFFIISENKLRETYRKAYQAFSSRYPKVQFAWSYKTNYINAVCRVFHQEGAWAEVVSGFEYDKALFNEVPGNQIIFNGPMKSENELTKSIENQSVIHIDHFDELIDLIRLSDSLKKKARVAIRINMDTGIFPKWDRFGFNFENGEAWKAIEFIMQSEFLDLIGLHTHIGTYILSTEAYRIAAQKMSGIAMDIHNSYGHSIQYLDLGGGFASANTLKGAYHAAADVVPSFDAYADAITSAILQQNWPGGDPPYLILETGRALVDEAGYLLSRVSATKRLSDGRRALILDVGINMLFTSFWYELEVHPGFDTTQSTDETDIVGPLCMNIDVIRKNLKYPLLEPGDPVVIPRVGAYNMTQWMQFITFRPAIYLIDENQEVHMIRKEENLEYMQELEQVPEHLKK
ncbi:MAG: diaminopimelate decarboxylase [Bacteroidetes bacterium]|nr:diaminopimelate decarboxylase [Bacteroidota bacterium]